MKVLLVDDEQAILLVFEEALKKGNIEVVTAINGLSALEKAKADKPDVILLDQILPDMNGNQVLEQLKQEELTKNIPVAMLSNFNQQNLIDEAMKLGSLDYIMKYQIAPQDLIQKVQQLYQEGHQQPAPQDQPVTG